MYWSLIPSPWRGIYDINEHKHNAKLQMAHLSQFEHLIFHSSLRMVIPGVTMSTGGLRAVVCNLNWLFCIFNLFFCLARKTNFQIIVWGEYLSRCWVYEWFFVFRCSEYCISVPNYVFVWDNNMKNVCV